MPHGVGASILLKLKRAQEHRNVLIREMTAFMDSEPYVLLRERNDERTQITVRLKVNREPPPYLSLVLADCVLNYRAALDHLAFNLPRRHGTALDWEGFSQFPISRDLNAFKSDSGSYLKGVDQKAVATIKSLQPYEGRAGPEGHPLWYLRELTDKDKHRFLRPLAMPVDWSQFGVVSAPAHVAHWSIVGDPTGLEDGAIIGKIYFSGWETAGEVTMEASISFNVAVDKIEPAIPLLRCINEIHESVISVVAIVAAFL